MQYLIIDSPGYYGDFATVYRVAEDRDAAIQAARRMGNVVVVSSEFPHENGQQIHRQFAAQYHVLWSRRQEAEARDQRAAATAETESEARMAAKYGRGSVQYNAAMSHPRQYRS